MGNLPFPVLCDIYMYYLEGFFLYVLKFKIYFRYVDDTFVFVDENIEIYHLISLVDFIQSCNQLTYEIVCLFKLFEVLRANFGMCFVYFIRRITLNVHFKFFFRIFCCTTSMFFSML